MSKESTSPDFVAQSQPAYPKKMNRKVNKNKSEVVPQTSGRENKTRETSNCENTGGKEKTKNNTKDQQLKSFKEKGPFPKYIPQKKIDILLKNQNSADPEYVEGYLRVNPSCYKYAYISLSDDESDLLIHGLRDRNRAFDGDYVVAYVNPSEKWHMNQGQLQKTGVVVCIREKLHSRKAIGYFKQRGANTLFYPRDQRVPLIKITEKSLEQFAVRPSNYEDTMYLAAITDWVKPAFAIGNLERIVGSIGDIKAASNAILLEHDLDVTPYSPEVIEGLPNSDYCLTENDLKDREDWRHECVFTIDPDTAVDLDDAISCRLLENGNYEIGVHISDVTHYLEFLSPLDIQVSKRATTVYMTDNVYHMLPKQLCQVCSLTPGQDKLAFSVIWEITPNTEIVTHRFAKTVIKSCCQMAYKHAQKFIKDPEDTGLNELLSISGNFSLSELSAKVNILHNLATQMRDKRFQKGALRIDQPKLYVSIDRITGLPLSYSIQEQQDSHRLIEEFMLLANMTVATHLYNTIPETALLRNHREPSKHILSITKDNLQRLGIHLDIESSGSLQASIKRYEQELGTEDDETKITTKYRMMVINSLCSKAMTRATYKCSSTVTTMEELWHYGLSVPLYTHFTSPIRRYSDCVVHRLLYSTIRNVKLPERWSKNMCNSIATICNVKKYNAKMAEELSSELYFAYLIELKGPIITMGIVLNVKQNFIDVILCQIGIKLRINFAQLENLAAVEYTCECSVPTINVSWKQPAVTQIINVFSLLHIRVEKHTESFQLIGNLLPPNQEIDL
ncbi:DIS3-like exonuclease 2 [Xylocopa sonorina]|uniref:DIS3-like exonuclease 2 n=1 Tax=Xylocopa sonorina TaxID=1818115 RepID=UPI00403B2B23